jgi:hypothetical protein
VKKWEYNETVYQLFIDFEKAYDSVRREILYNILTEFGVPMKLVRPTAWRFILCDSNVQYDHQYIWQLLQHEL